MKMKKNLGIRDPQGQKSVGLTGVDDNLRWERPQDVIKLCVFYKC